MRQTVRKTNDNMFYGLPAISIPFLSQLYDEKAYKQFGIDERTAQCCNFIHNREMLSPALNTHKTNCISVYNSLGFVGMVLILLFSFRVLLCNFRFLWEIFVNLRRNGRGRRSDHRGGPRSVYTIFVFIVFG